MTTHRVQAGVPSGGQFTTLSRPEAEVELGLRYENGWIPLKDQTPQELAHSISVEMLDAHGRDSDATSAVEGAIMLAWYAHDGQFRQSPTIASTGTPLAGSEPYLVHPLRNAVRILRWGEADPDIVAAAVLHDVVEDHAGKLAALDVTRRHRVRGDRAQRAAALDLLRSDFGGRVADIVEAVSNPLRDPGSNPNREQKRAVYVEHVTGAIDDYQAFMVKAADFVDNALSLHHQETGTDASRYRAWKYGPLCPVFTAAADRHQDAGRRLHPELLAKLTGAQDYLERINRVGTEHRA
ncbi:MAG: HD domain-containing protein [Nakamurella sp.]